ncbi:MAG: LexA family transcriptional regulator [Gammaproteobacteria bacterium]
MPETMTVTVKDIRRENLRALAISVGGITYLANKLGKSQSQISQLIGKSPSKNIGDKIAAQVEDIFGKPRGWLDILHHHIDETTTAYELIKHNAPHRAAPLITWHLYNNIPLDELAQSAKSERLIAANARLTNTAFAIRANDIEIDPSSEFNLIRNSILIIEPCAELQDGVYIVVPNQVNQLSLKRIRIEGKRPYLTGLRISQSQLEPLNQESPYAVVKQILIDL